MVPRVTPVNFRSLFSGAAFTMTALMTKRLLLSLLAVAVLSSTGCNLFHRKAKKPKESSAIATEVQKEFHQRWIAKRITELNAQGITGAAAQQQAEGEFRERFSFATPAK